MTEEDSLALNIGTDPQSERVSESFSFRDGVIFLIDTTEPMFAIDPDAGTSYFAQCLEVYRRILSEKLSWNKTDWMGIVLMGTNKWEQNPEIKHVLTWQKFEQVSVDQMIKIERTLANVEDLQSEIGSSSNFPLYDALLHVARCFQTVKIKMPFRNIILLTRVDNPCPSDPEEEYRIRLKAGDLTKLKIRLSVVGLGKQWNPEHFFAELEVYSDKFERADDYQRTFLADLEEEVKHSSRITAKLKWTIGYNLELGVCMNTITAKTKFPKQIRLNKKNNEPLDGYSFYRKVETGYSEDEEDCDEDGEADRVRIALPHNVYKYQQFGGRGIKFSMQEVFNMSNSCEPGIKLLGFKPQSKLDLSLHLEAPKFLSYNEEGLYGSKALFAALLKRCADKEVMGICAITLRTRSATHLYAMIPNIKYWGFYAYRLPFAENVRQFATIVPEYVYNDTNNVCPINEKTMDLCYRFIKKSSFAYDPTMFLNPKLHTELANIESLALDKDSCKIPIDSTIPDKDAARERLGTLRDRFEESVRICDAYKAIKRSRESSSVVRPKLSKADEELDFAELVRHQTVEKCTVKQLKDYLKSVGANPAGRKAELVDMVYSLFNRSK